MVNPVSTPAPHEPCEHCASRRHTHILCTLARSLTHTPCDPARTGVGGSATRLLALTLGWKAFFVFPKRTAHLKCLGAVPSLHFFAIAKMGGISSTYLRVYDGLGSLCPPPLLPCTMSMTF